jgi:hypothetical protein
LELVEKMDRWFGICNSVIPINAEAIADEFLSTPKWIEDWKKASTAEQFLTDETYKSLK